MSPEGGVLTQSPAHVAQGNGFSMSTKEPAPPGFTAVNGDHQRNSTFRPIELSNRSSQAEEQQTSCQSRENHFPSPAQRVAHGWRPEHRNSFDYRAQPPTLETTDLMKRKREAVEDAPDGDGRRDYVFGSISDSPKRRMTTLNSAVERLQTLDSAIDVSTPQDQHKTQTAISNDRRARQPLSIGTHSREQSPVARWNWNAKEPPPQPSRETMEELASSLQRELGANPPTEQQAASPENPAPHQDFNPDYRDRRSESYSPGQPAQQSIEGDPKRRKRNFSNRTKTGCHTCRGRKKKCDERKPFCANCERSGNQCAGYGAKPPPNLKANLHANRTQVPLQSKPYQDVQAKHYQNMQQGPVSSFPNGFDEHQLYPQWSRAANETEPPRAPFYDRRQHVPRPSWPSSEPPPSYQLERLSSASINQISPPPNNPPAHPPKGAPQPPSVPPLPTDPWTGYPGASHRPSTSGMRSSRASVSTSTSERTAALALGLQTGTKLSERDKMLLGRPFLHYHSDVLLSDRQSCQKALERYNDSAKTSSFFTVEERGRFFQAIVEPKCRPNYMAKAAYQPKGSIGEESIVESPFNCDYGYNLRIGRKVVISANCYFQDACEIHIGDRTIVGPNVKFYGITASVDAQAREGSRGQFLAGAIRVAEDVFIGGDSIILPFRSIGKGAVVGAGSVVTKDVKEYTVVAGNPAKFIRRIEPGPNIERHHPEIQEQNQRMMQDMLEAVKRVHER